MFIYGKGKRLLANNIISTTAPDEFRCVISAAHMSDWIISTTDMSCRIISAADMANRIIRSATSAMAYRIV